MELHFSTRLHPRDYRITVRLASDSSVLFHLPVLWFQIRDGSLAIFSEERFELLCLSESALVSPPVRPSPPSFFLQILHLASLLSSKSLSNFPISPPSRDLVHCLFDNRSYSFLKIVTLLSCCFAAGAAGDPVPASHIRLIPLHSPFCGTAPAWFARDFLEEEAAATILSSFSDFSFSFVRSVLTASPNAAVLQAEDFRLGWPINLQFLHAGTARSPIFADSELWPPAP
nr:hypothetical protein Iba_chr03dCG7600 [Ipomoea batatas]